MKQSELQTREMEFLIEALQYQEFLHHEMRKRRSALHSDILEIIECASEEYSLVHSVSNSLGNRILSKDEIENVKCLLEIMSTDLKKAGHEYSELEMLLTRWTMFHEKILSPRQ